MTAHRVRGFLPSTSGFRFANCFAPQPLLRLGPFALGDASLGLCGGMILAALEYHNAGVAPPDDLTPPTAGTPLYRHLVRRLFASFRLPRGAWRWYRWTSRADDAHLLRMTATEAAKVWLGLADDLLVPLGLVRLHARNPWRMAHNHQVLAYAAAQTDDSLTFWVYDPNHPCNDDVTVTLSTKGVTQSTGEPLRGFFVTAR